MALTALIGGVALALLVAGKIPVRRPLSFARVFRFLFCVFFLLIVPAAVLRLPKSYSSTSQIKIVSGAKLTAPDAEFIQKEMEKIVSLSFLRPIMSELSVENLWGEPFRSIQLNENDAYQLLRRAIKLEPGPGAAELKLTVFGENAEVPATFANRIASEYAGQVQKLSPEIRVTWSRAESATLPNLANLARNAIVGLVLTALTTLAFSMLWVGCGALKARVSTSNPTFERVGRL